MPRCALVWAMVGLAAGCGPAGGGRDGASAELAPTGTIRAAVNFANPVLATRETPDGAPGGVSVALARELGRRLDRPVEFLAYDSAALMAADAGTGAWDVAFLAADPGREDEIAFSPPYVELEATYLVPAESRFRTLDDVDADGVRIAARPRSAYDLFLRRSLARAELVYPEGAERDLDLLVDGRADVLAGLRHVLVDAAATLPAVRVLDGHFASMQQAIGVPRGRTAAAAYLREFIEDVIASGFVGQAVAARGAPGVSPAPSARR